MSRSEFIEDEIQMLVQEWMDEGFTMGEAYRLAYRQIERFEP